MSIKRTAHLELEQLLDRIVPTTAVLSHGVLFVQGDNLGNNINVLADSNGNIQVTERGQAVAIDGHGAATTKSVKLVVEVAGTGANNTLSTAASLGAIPDTLIGNGSGTVTFKPLNNAPSTAFGSPNRDATNDFFSNVGGKDFFVGGRGTNVFDWESGDGTNTYIGAGKSNTVVVDSLNNTAENDSLTRDRHGRVDFSSTSPVPFEIYTRGIQDWYIRPSTEGNTVTIGNLKGAPTKQVEVDASYTTVDASAQKNAKVQLVVKGAHDTVLDGAGPTTIITPPPPPPPTGGTGKGGT